MKKLLKKLSQIVIVHSADVFIALYPLGKWKLSKEVNIFREDNLVQTVWYIANVQVGVWHSAKEVTAYA